MFPDDPDVQKVKAAFYDPFEYLFLRTKKANSIQILNLLATSAGKGLSLKGAKY